MELIINPGSGSVPDATEANAQANMTTFVEDLGVEGASVERDPGQDAEGRFAFILTLTSGTEFEIDMPGLPLDQVRPGIPWEQPRLYVDGSSWLWGFALGVIE